MGRPRLDRHLVLGELREVFWEWDPLGLSSERDLLADEYDRQVERTLDLLEDGADEAIVSADLSGWLDRSTPPGWRDRDPRGVDRQTQRLDRWWQEFLGRPPPAPESPLWGTPSIGALLVVWLAVVAGSIALRIDDIAALPFEAGLVSLAPTIGGLAFALLPAAAILGAPKVATQHPLLLAGSAFLVLSRAIPGIVGNLRLIYTFDLYEDPVLFTLAQTAVNVLHLSLTLVAAYLLVLALRRLGADPGRWVVPTVLLVAGLVLSGYAVAFLGYGQLWVESVTGNIPGLLWAFAIGWAGLFAVAAVFVFALAGARERLLPRPAWLLMAAGFGAWLLAPVASTLSIIIGQAAPELGATWIAGYVLSVVADVALPAAFLAGLGGGEATPPWLRVLRDRWLLGKAQAAARTA